MVTYRKSGDKVKLYVRVGINGDAAKEKHIIGYIKKELGVK